MIRIRFKTQYIMTFIIIIYCIFLILTDIFGKYTFVDVPEIIKFNSHEIVFSSFYKNAYFFGADLMLILCMALFDLFIFIPIGFYLYKTSSSVNKIFKIYLIISFLYNLLKFSICISPLAFDLVILNFMGMVYGFFLKKEIGLDVDKYTKLNVEIKKIYFLLFFLLFIFMLPIKGVTENISDRFSNGTKYYLKESDISNILNDTSLDKEFRQTYKSYNNYKKILNDKKQENILSGRFKGISNENDKDSNIKIKIDNNIYKLKISEDSRILYVDYAGDDKKFDCLSYKLSKYFDKDRSVFKNIIRNNDLSSKINSGSEVMVISDKNNVVETIVIKSNYFKGVNKY